MGVDATRAYVDQRVDDAAGAALAADVAARQWGLRAPELVRVGMNAIYVVDDVVLRVGTPTVPAEASIELARFLRSSGLPVPAPARSDVVRTGELSVTAWERIEAATDDGGGVLPLDWAALGSVIRRLHTIEATAFPASVPLPHPAVLPWWKFDELLARATAQLDATAHAGLSAAIERHRGWEQFAGAVVCHGDVHPGNVVMSANGPVLLDWDLLCLAPPGWDHGPLLTLSERWGGPAGVYDEFAEGYGRTLADDGPTQAFAELRLVAATLMRVIVSIDEPSARPEADRRLQYWRGDVQAPVWNAQ